MCVSDCGIFVHIRAPLGERFGECEECRQATVISERSRLDSSTGVGEQSVLQTLPPGENPVDSARTSRAFDSFDAIPTDWKDSEHLNVEFPTLQQPAVFSSEPEKPVYRSTYVPSPKKDRQLTSGFNSTVYTPHPPLRSKAPVHSTLNPTAKGEAGSPNPWTTEGQLEIIRFFDKDSNTFNDETIESIKQDRSNENEPKVEQQSRHVHENTENSDRMVARWNAETQRWIDERSKRNDWISEDNELLLEVWPDGTLSRTNEEKFAEFNQRAANRGLLSPRSGCSITNRVSLLRSKGILAWNSSEKWSLPEKRDKL